VQRPSLSQRAPHQVRNNNEHFQHHQQQQKQQQSFSIGNNLRTILLGYAALVNVSAYGLFWYDKQQAVQRGWRIPEKTLQLSALAGGYIGGMVFLLIILLPFYHHIIRYIKLEACNGALSSQDQKGTFSYGVLCMCGVECRGVCIGDVAAKYCAAAVGAAMEVNSMRQQLKNKPTNMMHGHAGTVTVSLSASAVRTSCLRRRLRFVYWLCRYWYTMKPMASTSKNTPATSDTRTICKYAVAGPL
jgi:uncharacterized membrane protein YsdA (DUF1294 family)